MTGVIRWEEPPSTGRGTAEAKAEQWRPMAEQLRAEPGKWALVDEGNVHGQTALVGYIRTGRGPFAPAKSFEAKQRTDPEPLRSLAPRTGKVYARYVGGEAS